MFVGCSSTKSRDDQSAVAKLWHNMNSHYNGYFNAAEIMDESLLALEEQHVDNYTQRLDMFPFLAVDDVSGVAPELDRAIEKVAVVVKKHPYSNWVDDSYLLLGQAQLIKQDYESAERTLAFMVNEFRPRPKRAKTKGRKKRGGAAGAAPEEGEEFVSRREVETDQSQSRRDRLRARKQAQKERDRVRKDRAKERKRAKKERDRERKARIRARKKGIKLPPRARPDTSTDRGLDNEPEPEVVTELDEGPVGMISIFSNRDASGAGAGSDAYGKKAGSYALKHRPAYQEGRLWLAWTLIKRDNFDRAQIILDDLRADRGTFSDVRRKAMAVQAYLYLEQDKLSEAIPFLEEAAAVARERNERARYYYIAGQLYQELRNAGPAQEAFRQVVASRPAYELELGARINLAQNAFLSGSGSAAGALKDLERMVREEKNLPYESQILFSMAAIAIQDGDRAAGRAYLRRALDSPSAAANQQLEAYQLLGDIAYDTEDYLAAKLYYDSTLNVMGQNDARFPTTSGRRDQLSGIAGYLQEIELQDSLLRIGQLPEAERRELAERTFELRRAANSAANFAANSPGTAGRAGGRNPLATTNSSDFWGYDAQTFRRGAREFERRWGDRPLEDDWRRSSRTDRSLFTDEDDLATGFTDEPGPSIMTEDELNAILADVPITEEDQLATRRRLAEAYFGLGRDYRDKLANNPRAIRALETLDQQYPGGDAEAESWYLLYLMHTEAGNAARAQQYATKLGDKYRGSKYAKLAADPAYAATLLSEQDRQSRDYETAYAAFAAGDYERAHGLARTGRGTLLGEHPLKARYALLLAMTTGKLEGRDAYVAELRQVVSQFPSTQEETRAKEILRLLGESGARLPGRSGGGAGALGSSGFRPSYDELHYLILVFDDPQAALNDAKNNVADYNKKYHKLDRLRITNVYLGQSNDTPVLVMRRFKSGAEAMDYFNQSQANEREFLDPGRYGYRAYAVSQSNYREILKAKTPEGYEAFFIENYLQ